MSNLVFYILSIYLGVGILACGFLMFCFYVIQKFASDEEVENQIKVVGQKYNTNISIRQIRESISNWSIYDMLEIIFTWPKFLYRAIVRRKKKK